jgi:NAD(P)-dependent dehydrogenase (short-subunit alcohol dehydrogenase family)
MEGLKNKVIVFAGAGGIATATATFLGAGGAKLVVGDASLASAERTVNAATEAGGEGVATTLDISDEQQVEALIGLAIKHYGRIDGLFNVAANIDPAQVEQDTNVVEIDLAAWQRTIDVNLTGYLLTRPIRDPAPSKSRRGIHCEHVLGGGLRGHGGQGCIFGHESRRDERSRAISPGSMARRTSAQTRSLRVSS